MAQTQRFEEEKWVADFLVSEANLYRSREVITIPEGADGLSPGALLTMAGASATAANAEAVLMYPTDPTRGPVQAVVIARDAEVNDAYLLYGDLDRAAVNASLAKHGIIVRPGVLSQSIVSPADAGMQAAAEQASPVAAEHSQRQPRR
jgi:head decoration protein D